MNPLDRNPSACELARCGMLDHLEPRSTFHCDACRVWFERARTHALAIRGLTRQVPDPAELDGLVVAELNAGRRQERAAAAFLSLARLEAPAQLDELVRDRLAGSIRSAPAELDQRVAQELAAGSSLRIERQIRALTPMAAPHQLDALVAESLALSRVPARPSARWIALAAAILLVVGSAALLQQSGLFRPKPYEFRVVRTDSTASLDPMTRGWVSAASGVFLDQPGEAR